MLTSTEVDTCSVNSNLLTYLLTPILASINNMRLIANCNESRCLPSLKLQFSSYKSYNNNLPDNFSLKDKCEVHKECWLTSGKNIPVYFSF